MEKYNALYSKLPMSPLWSYVTEISDMNDLNSWKVYWISVEIKFRL
jgi:hypothetical protein